MSSSYQSKSRRIADLEREVANLRAELDVARALSVNGWAFHKVAVAERDEARALLAAERLESEALRQRLAKPSEPEPEPQFKFPPPTLAEMPDRKNRVHVVEGQHFQWGVRSSIYDRSPCCGAKVGYLNQKRRMCMDCSAVYTPQPVGT